MKNTTVIITAIITYVFLLSSPILAQKVAYVVGNNAYSHAGILVNAKKDAKDIGARLNAHGFKVLSLLDAGEQDMKSGLEKFATEGQGAEVCMFFFSGHGFQIGEQNYLVPTDGRLTTNPENSMVSLNSVLKALNSTNAKLKIVVLDCCRNNPFKDQEGGLASISSSSFPKGSLIIYAGSPGKTVPDGAGENSPFTSELMEQLQPGRDCLSLFTSVAAARYQRQDPWIKFDGSGTTLSLLRSYDLLGATGDGEKIDLPKNEDKPRYQVSSLWDHNGSTMGLLVRGNERILIYVKVRKGLTGFVEPGTVLFHGKALNGKYIGQARRFTKGLSPIQYSVEGLILNGGSKVVLKGRAPIRNKDGSIQKYVNDELSFEYLQLSK